MSLKLFVLKRLILLIASLLVACKGVPESDCKRRVYIIAKGKNLFILPKSFFTTSFQAKEGDSLYIELRARSKLTRFCIYYTSLELECFENVDSLSIERKLDHQGEYRIAMVNRTSKRIFYSLEAYRVQCIRSKLYE